MQIDYVLTTFSPAMFGDRATAHIRAIPVEEVQALITSKTKIAATRISHERFARETFPNANPEVRRYATLNTGANAVLLHYRGPPMGENGVIPSGGLVTCYLIETEAYQDSEED